MSGCFDWTPNHLRCPAHKETEMPIEGNNMHGGASTAEVQHDKPYVDRIGQEQRRDYTKNVLCDIGWAVKQLHDGQRIRRAGWNGKGMWLTLVTDWNGNLGLPSEDWAGSLPFVMMYTADRRTVPWLCSQTDLLATDWECA